MCILSLISSSWTRDPDSHWNVRLWTLDQYWNIKIRSRILPNLKIIECGLEALTFSYMFYFICMCVFFLKGWLPFLCKYTKISRLIYQQWSCTTFGSLCYRCEPGTAATTSPMSFNILHIPNSIQTAGFSPPHLFGSCHSICIVCQFFWKQYLYSKFGESGIACSHSANLLILLEMERISSILFSQ